MLQRQFCVHVLEPSVFFFQLTQAANVGGFHAAVLCLPLVVGGVADFVFATNVSDGLARLDGFQDGDDLRLAEFALSHSASWRHTRPETSTFQWPGFKGGLQSNTGWRCYGRGKIFTDETAFLITARGCSSLLMELQLTTGKRPRLRFAQEKLINLSP